MNDSRHWPGVVGAVQFAADNGILPNGVIFHGGTLYGTTDLSGANETFGTVFRMTP